MHRGFFSDMARKVGTAAGKTVGIHFVGWFASAARAQAKSLHVWLVY